MECKQTTLTRKFKVEFIIHCLKKKAPMKFVLKFALKLWKEKLENFLSI